MIYGTNQYGHTSKLLDHYIDQQHHHEHLPTKKMTAFDSILHDHSITVVNAGKRMLQGVGICVGIGIMGYFHKSAEKKLITDRTIGQDWHYVKRFRVHAAYGALAGLTWFFLYDQFLCPHGQSTLTRHMIAYTIGGSLVTMTIWNPASFFYGGVIGAIVGGYIANRDTKPTPAGFQIQLPKFDQKQRQRVKRDEQQYRLSQKLRANSASIKTRHFVL